MMYSLIAYFQTITNATKPVNKRLPLGQVRLVWFDGSSSALRVLMHSFNGTIKGDLRLVADLALSNGFHKGP